MTPVGPFDGTISADVARRVAAATGATVPAALLATRLWEAQEGARTAVVPDDIQRSARGGVHGEHDIVVHRAPVPDEPLRTWVELHGVHPAGRNTAVVVRYSTVDAADAVVAEQWWTTVYLGTAAAPAGARGPDHAIPDGARQHVLGTHSIDVDVDMARRYAEASGDWSAHHFDADAARASGADRPFLHGLATMALCARAVVAVTGVDPDRVGRLAVRFATPMPLGEWLVVQVYDAGASGIAFEATGGGAVVATHGRVELL